MLENGHSRINFEKGDMQGGKERSLRNGSIPNFEGERGQNLQSHISVQLRCASGHSAQKQEVVESVGIQVGKLREADKRVPGRWHFFGTHLHT